MTKSGNQAISLVSHWKTLLLVLFLLELAGVVYFHFFIGIGFFESACLSIFGNTGLLVSILFTSYLLSLYRPSSGVKVYLMCLCFVLGALSAAIVYTGLKHWNSFLTNPQEVLPVFLTYTVPVNVAMHILFGVFSIFSLAMHESKASENRKETIHELTREAELSKLQQQLQPHFLFNSLNSINALILSRPGEAQEMVQKLSEFLRATLKRSNEQWVPLGEELNYLQLYLDIEKVRFGHRMEVRFFVGDEANSVPIPCLILQPIVENAIKYGLYGTTGNVIVVMNVKVTKNYLSIELSNPFDADMQPQAGTGFGLKGISRRLYLLYARNDLLETKINGNLFITHLKIPRDL